MAEQSVNYHISPENTIENRLSPDKMIEKSYKTQDNIVESDLNAVNEIQKKLKDALDSINQLSLKMEMLEATNACLKAINEELILKVESFETYMEKMKNDNYDIKRKITELELLIVRNNINIDLLANRDSLK